MTTATQLVQDGTDYYNKGDIASFCSLYSDDVVLTTPDGRFEGRADVESYLQSVHASAPDGQVTIGRHCEADDTYFGEFSLRGVNTGPVAMPDGSTLPPTQQTVEIRGSEIATTRNGRIVQHDMLWDNLSLLGQLGLTPTG